MAEQNGQPKIDTNDLPIALVLIAIVMFLIGFVGSSMFVCCDSAQSRKVYAITTLIAGLGNLLLS